MREIYALTFCFVFLGIISCQKENIEKKPVFQTQDVTIKNGYLSFKTVEVFENVKKTVENNDKLYYQWFSQFNGFESAKSILDNADYEVENSKKIEDIELIKNKYKGKLVYNEDSGFSYNFYANSLAGFLNYDGLVMIEGVLYKYTKSTQICVLEGGEEALINYLSAKKSKTNQESIIELESQISSNGWGILQQIDLHSGRSWLYSNIELNGIYSPIYTNYIHTGWKVGFELSITAHQDRKNFFGQWYNNKTVFDVWDGAFSLFYPLDGNGYSNQGMSTSSSECRNFSFCLCRLIYNYNTVNVSMERPSSISVSAKITSRGISPEFITHEYSE